MKRRILSILLIFCFVAPVVTTYFVLKYQRKQVKRAVKWNMIAGLNKDELVLLKFTEEEKQTNLRWEHSKEFEYLGEMYDIVETKIIGDTTYYRCWWDHKETKLNKQLANLVVNALANNPENKEKRDTLIKFFKTLYCSAFPSKGTFVPSVSNCYFSAPTHLSPSELIAPPAPPPEIV